MSHMSFRCATTWATAEIWAFFKRLTYPWWIERCRKHQQPGCPLFGCRSKSKRGSNGHSPWRFRFLQSCYRCSLSRWTKKCFAGSFESSQYRFWFLFHRTSSPKRVSPRRQLSAQKSDKGGTCLAAIKVEIKPIMRPATQFQCTSSIIPNRDVIPRLSNIDRKVRLCVLSFGVEPKFFVQVKPPYALNWYD